MYAARQRACHAARQLPRTARTYASEAHHTPAAPANESFGKGSIAAVGGFFAAVAVFSLKPAEGEESFVSGIINKYRSRAEDWAEISALHTKAAEQAGYDRNLFENASNKHRYVNVSYPEAFQSHAPRNIQAGQLVNLDHVVEHYKKEHLKDEERKAKNLAQQN
ncbi:NADH-ubiquinone oxidoreductase 17.8 kDa subunit [Cordyceps fumosorosea ARSEF 2679]|uniref:NADH-ubiquinone oxidoreductase 17.8 kDa subunit n=1 Tax=Cordyceps fumosorosea (strain ARSEF 2679) TaxID=1081104 RepID=A0A167ZIQ5_CORFA|nr:NADH-ubiquinone oxidoreductase 17.8 kDa subunit [Cordyceps fumosorosea ARSEF 2679]OAA67566.1 NADH-ubiquinone oxidoreductase 17.8 kDa subunit [Cordyceps fumosorosea ARSEF 2679]